MILFKRFIVLFCFSVLAAFQVHTEDVFYLLPKGSYIFSEEDVFRFDSVPREKQGEMIYEDLSVFYREGNAYYSGGIKDVPDCKLGKIGNTGKCYSRCGGKYSTAIRVEKYPNEFNAGWGTHLHLQVEKMQRNS